VIGVLENAKAVSDLAAMDQNSEKFFQAKEILRMKEALNKILKAHTGKDLSQIQKDTDRDYFMSGQEARDYGIVDLVIRNRDDLDEIDKSEA
jgi:ATP-dependent Clp protease protease subunit